MIESGESSVIPTNVRCGPKVSETCAVATIRRATAEDRPFLQEMLAVAADWRPDAYVRSLAELMGEPALAHYVAGWPMEGDVGFVVEDSRPVGAAWWRFFPDLEPGFGFVDESTPEVSIGVVRGFRGIGLRHRPSSGSHRGRPPMRPAGDEPQRRTRQPCGPFVRAPWVYRHRRRGWFAHDDSETRRLTCNLPQHAGPRRRDRPAFWRVPDQTGIGAERRLGRACSSKREAGRARRRAIPAGFRDRCSTRWRRCYGVRRTRRPGRSERCVQPRVRSAAA